MLYLDIEIAPINNKHLQGDDCFKAELNKVVSVAVNENGLTYSIQGAEKDILTYLAPILSKAGQIVAHNGRNFDYPFLTKRYIINRLTPPQVLTAEQKPWDTYKQRIDTNDLWNPQTFHKTSLELLCQAFSIKTPKDTLRGEDVAQYFSEGKIDQVSLYCIKDVVALQQVYLAITKPTSAIKNNTTYSIPVVAITPTVELVFQSLKDAALFVRRTNNTNQNAAQAAICRCLGGLSKQSYNLKWRYASV